MFIVHAHTLCNNLFYELNENLIACILNVWHKMIWLIRWILFKWYSSERNKMGFKILVNRHWYELGWRWMQQKCIHFMNRFENYFCLWLSTLYTLIELFPFAQNTVASLFPFRNEQCSRSVINVLFFFISFIFRN